MRQAHLNKKWPLYLGKNYFLLKIGLGKNYSFLGSIYIPLSYLARHNVKCPWLSVVTDATHEGRLRDPLKGAKSAHKHRALQGSGTETRELPEGTKENNILPIRKSLICPPGKWMIFSYKKQKNWVGCRDLLPLLGIPRRPEDPIWAPCGASNHENWYMHCRVRPYSLPLLTKPQSSVKFCAKVGLKFSKL